MIRGVHCRKCWQLVSLFARRCPNCGDTDPVRFRKAIVELMLVAVALAGAGGIALLAISNRYT